MARGGRATVLKPTACALLTQPGLRQQCLSSLLALLHLPLYQQCLVYLTGEMVMSKGTNGHIQGDKALVLSCSNKRGLWRGSSFHQFCWTKSSLSANMSVKFVRTPMLVSCTPCAWCSGRDIAALWTWGSWCEAPALLTMGTALCHHWWVHMCLSWAVPHTWQQALTIPTECSWQSTEHFLLFHLFMYLLI